MIRKSKSKVKASTSNKNQISLFYKSAYSIYHRLIEFLGTLSLTEAQLQHFTQPILHLQGVFNVTLFPHSSLNCSNFEVNIMLQGEEKYKWNAQVGQEDVALIYCQYGARVR